LAAAAWACSGVSLRRLDRKLIRSAGISNTAPAVPSKDKSSISIAAGLFRSFVMIPSLAGVDGRRVVLD
jgi:hypothetical protein